MLSTVPELQGFISFIIFLTVVHRKPAFKGSQLYYCFLKLNQHFTAKLILLLWMAENFLSVWGNWTEGSCMGLLPMLICMYVQIVITWNISLSNYSVLVYLTYESRDWECSLCSLVIFWVFPLWKYLSESSSSWFHSPPSCSNDAILISLISCFL